MTRQVASLRSIIERAVGPVDDALWETVVPLARARHSDKGEHIVRAGDHVHVFGFILSGLVRRYHLDDHGVEVTTAFLHEGHPFGPLAELVSGEPSSAFYECLEEVEAVTLRWNDWQALCAREPGWNRVSRAVTELLLGHLLEREAELLSMDGEARYRRLCERAPRLVERAPLRHVASYLGMRPESLSRIRKKVATSLP